MLSLRSVARSPTRVAASAVEECKAKHLTRLEMQGRIETIRGAWPELQRSLWSQLRPVEELRVMLASAGCPTTPEELGLSAELKADYARARMIRTRYTLLDLAAGRPLGDAGQITVHLGRLLGKDELRRTTLRRQGAHLPPR